MLEILPAWENYARFYFDRSVNLSLTAGVLAFNDYWIFYRLFPNLKKAIYLDSDIIVQHDIKDLWREVFTSEYIVTAVER